MLQPVSILVLCALVQVLRGILPAAELSASRDSYGGFAAVRAEATGFFRVEQVGGRWWFITPEGHGFIAVGFNHATRFFLSGSYNRGQWAARVRDAREFEDMVLADARAWNCTALGYGMDSLRARTPDDPLVAEVLPRGRFPYVKALPFPLRSGWSPPETPQPDVFSEKFARACERIAREQAAPLADDPWLIGYYFVDIPQWPAGDAAATARFAEQYYAVASAAVRRADPHHLLLGDRLDGNRGFPDSVVKAAARHVDVLSVQFYGEFEKQQRSLARWSGMTGKPVLLADSCFALRPAAMPRPNGPALRSDAERADAFERYARAALGEPHILGWFWCGYLDSSEELQPRFQHSGLKDAWGAPHEPLVARMRALYADLFALSQPQTPHSSP